jgi:hypothetical protein
VTATVVQLRSTLGEESRLLLAGLAPLRKPLPDANASELSAEGPALRKLGEEEARALVEQRLAQVEVAVSLLVRNENWFPMRLALRPLSVAYPAETFTAMGRTAPSEARLAPNSAHTIVLPVTVSIPGETG